MLKNHNKTWIEHTAQYAASLSPLLPTVRCVQGQGRVNKRNAGTAPTAIPIPRFAGKRLAFLPVKKGKK